MKRQRDTDIGKPKLGQAERLRVHQSASAAVEEDAYQQFSISLFDVEGGALSTDAIDIDSISVSMEKSTGGGAFSDAGITQPTFLEATGRVYVGYKFKAAEWAAGDMYRLAVSGITATIAGQTAYVGTLVWSNIVLESATLDSSVTSIKTTVEDIHDVSQGSSGVFYEQPDVAVSVNAILASETDVLHLAVADTRYIVRSLRLKCVDPGAETITVRLKQLVNNSLVTVDSFEIDGGNFGTYHSLMDMFGLPELVGDELQVTVQASGGSYAVTGQYSFAKNNV